MTDDSTRRARRTLLLPGILRGIGDILVAVAFLVIGLYLVDELRDTRTDLECRSEITGEVSQAEGQLKVETFDGLVAVATDDDEALAVAVEKGTAAKARLEAALRARENLEQTCKG